ncbi:2-hydroxychromene-2-carboxylate isomerase [Actinokineospora diospyrosa]|uniref:2-hydroxychromene-2-carboxylate isomerase n=1 Tax=Actinokineospora diospyrosa TaxID=103728 RepID=A0ABT1I9T8_9PSEU|nr:DsbA family protein [Actinokineospora diospyrosa]MCP2269397.1 2-hydroxychromene-2-carboxylate isomerase [Actinokineospora diospyrosa]
MRTKRPRVFFALNSPYSWMAVRDLLARVPDVVHRADFIPFWEPDKTTEAALHARGAEIIYVPMSKAKHLYLLADTKRLAQERGYPLVWPVDVDPWWELPNLAWLHARRAGQAWPFYLALTEARWERGENICDPQVVRAAALACDMNPDTVLDAPSDPSLRAEGVDMLTAAYEDDIFGVPYFRLGRHRYWGLDRLEHFIAALSGPDTAAPSTKDIPAPVLAATGAFDRDTAGGCG